MLINHRLLQGAKYSLYRWLRVNRTTDSDLNEICMRRQHSIELPSDDIIAPKTMADPIRNLRAAEKSVLKYTPTVLESLSATMLDWEVRNVSVNVLSQQWSKGRHNA